MVTIGENNRTSQKLVKSRPIQKYAKPKLCQTKAKGRPKKVKRAKIRQKQPKIISQTKNESKIYQIKKRQNQKWAKEDQNIG